jgi:hypothetical protein
MTPPQSVPTIPGWDITTEDGWLTATRRAPLTDYQRLYGAMPMFSVRTEDELLFITDAQQRLAERLVMAEFAAPKDRPLYAAAGELLDVLGATRLDAEGSS